MKQIAKNELFKNLSGFLKDKGIELTDGAYAKGIRQSCSLLTNAINLGQQSLGKAKTEIDKTCEKVRQAVHEKTGPKPPPASPAPKAKVTQAKSTAKKSSRPGAAKPRSKRQG